MDAKRKVTAGGQLPADLLAAFVKAENFKTDPFQSWCDPAGLPVIRVAGEPLSNRRMELTIHSLRKSARNRPHPLVEALRRHANAADLEALALRIFKAWNALGRKRDVNSHSAGPSLPERAYDGSAKEKWPLYALGFFGGDAALMELDRHILGPSAGRHSHALASLDALGWLGTGAAVTLLLKAAAKSKTRAMRIKANAVIGMVAERRGLDRDALEDMTVPDLGLDEDGSRVFDYGARQFRAVIGPGLNPVLRDATGSLLKNLSPSGAKDDPVKAAGAQKEWKQFKMLLKRTAAVQTHRLECAMIDGRRWRLEAFREYILGHPLMIQLARSLVWERFDAKGNPKPGCFRPAEDGAPADADDRPMDLTSAAQIGLVHPYRLGEEERGQWGRVLADYEIIQPFPQINREVFTLTNDEGKAKELTRFAGRRTPGHVLIRTLDGRGWIRDDYHGYVNHAHAKHKRYAGFERHARYFRGAHVTALAGHGGANMTVSEIKNDLSVETVYFLDGNVRPIAGDPENAIELGNVDPVVVSETLRDLEALAAKGKWGERRRYFLSQR